MLSKKLESFLQDKQRQPSNSAFFSIIKFQLPVLQANLEECHTTWEGN
jgi:hypothetical protein